MTLQDSSECSQESAIGLCTELEETGPQPSNLFA